MDQTWKGEIHKLEGELPCFSASGVSPIPRASPMRGSYTTTTFRNRTSTHIHNATIPSRRVLKLSLEHTLLCAKIKITSPAIRPIRNYSGSPAIRRGIRHLRTYCPISTYQSDGSQLLRSSNTLTMEEIQGQPPSLSPSCLG